MKSKVSNIPTRFALIKRAEKILADIDQYFDDADGWGLSVAESDPDGVMTKMRQGLVAMLVKEGRIKPMIPDPEPPRRTGG